MAQLVERSYTTPYVRGSNLVIRKIYIERLLSTVMKNETKEKRPGMVRVFKQMKNYFILIKTHLTQYSIAKMDQTILVFF